LIPKRKTGGKGIGLFFHTGTKDDSRFGEEGRPREMLLSGELDEREESQGDRKTQRGRGLMGSMPEE
jgi:hypothetical protein